LPCLIRTRSSRVLVNPGLLQLLSRGLAEAVAETDVALSTTWRVRCVAPAGNVARRLASAGVVTCRLRCRPDWEQEDKECKAPQPTRKWHLVSRSLGAWVEVNSAETREAQRFSSLVASSVYKNGPSLTSACGPACGWASLCLRHAGTLIILDAVRFVCRDTAQASGEARATWTNLSGFHANPRRGWQQGWHRSRLNRHGIICDHLWRASTSCWELMCFVASNFANPHASHRRRFQHIFPSQGSRGSHLSDQDIRFCSAETKKQTASTAFRTLPRSPRARV
jgi:hypothetical protein